MKQKYKYTSRGVPVHQAYGEEEFDILKNYSEEGWKLHSIVTCPKWRNYIFEIEVPAPQKPDYSNASIAKANELLTEAQKKEGIQSIPTFKCLSCLKYGFSDMGQGCPGNCEIVNSKTVERGDGRTLLFWHLPDHDHMNPTFRIADGEIIFHFPPGYTYEKACAEIMEKFHGMYLFSLRPSPERETLFYEFHYISQGQSYAELTRKDGSVFYRLVLACNIHLGGAREYIEEKFPGMYEIIDLRDSVDCRP